MMSVTVHGMGQDWRIDTADPALIGPWLQALFKDLKPHATAPRMWTITVNG